MRFYNLTALVVLLSFLYLPGCTPSAKYLKKMSKVKNNSVDSNYIRVLVKTSKSPIPIFIKGPFRVVKKNSRKVLYEARKGMVRFYPGKVREPYLVESKGSPIYVGERGYRGIIEVREVMGKLYFINEVNVENYLYSVVPSEMPSSWNIEALKAQAIAARTYTFYHLEKADKGKRLYDVDSSTRFQVYKGIGAEKPIPTKAVNETAGIIMTHNYEPILAYFHSTSGGLTADDRDVWEGNDFPYLESVPSKYERDSPHFRWKTVLSIYEIKAALLRKYRNVGTIKKIGFKKKNGRVSSVVVVHSNGTLDITGNHFRLLFPPKKLRSTYFISRKQGNSLYISGRGWGHGVGMSQWGAKGMADSGMKCEKILRHFYRGISLTSKKNPFFANKKYRRRLVN